MFAIGLLCCLLASTPAQQPNGPSLSADRDRAIQLYQNRDFKGAVKALNSIVKKDKADGEAWHYLGLALARDNQISKAKQAFERATRLRPDFGPARTSLAYTLILMNRDAEAAIEAAKAIELDSGDAEAHYVLAVARLRQRNTDDAKESVEAAIRLKPNLAGAHLVRSEVYLAIYVNRTGLRSKIVAVSSDRNSEERQEARRYDRTLLKTAAEALERYLSLNPTADDVATWREQLETLRVYAGIEGDLFGPSEVTTKSRVLSKPEPNYTPRARAAGIIGTVVLRAVFSSDGAVRHILVIRSLPYGLTEAAIAAARRIKFEPAIKDGNPVSMAIQLEYNFNLY